MPRENLSQDFFMELCKNRPKKTLHYMDKDLDGFLLEYRKTGLGTWYFFYNSPITGNKSYFRIGSTKDMNAAIAREEAYRLHFLIAKGNDPKTKNYLETQNSYKIKEQNKMLKSSETSCHTNTRLAERTLENFIFEKYLPFIKSNKKSWRVDKHTFDKYFLPTFGQGVMHTVCSRDILTWLDTLLQKGLSQSTCNRILASIKSLFNYAVKWNILDFSENPCLHIPNFPKFVPKPRYLDKEEIKKVFLSLQSMKMIGAKALQLLLLTGAKKNEILTARWEYVDFQERTLAVPADQFSQTRFIPLSDEAMQILEKLYDAKKSVWVFPSNNLAKHITSLSYVWDAVRKKNGLQDVRIQDLRHSFGSVLMSSGASLHDVQKILGHHDPKSTMRYAHFAKNSLINTANKVGECVRVE